MKLFIIASAISVVAMICYLVVFGSPQNKVGFDYCINSIPDDLEKMGAVDAISKEEIKKALYNYCATRFP